MFMQVMFMDGIIYAGIAKHLTWQTISTLQLNLSKSYGANFYGHPPLSMIIHFLFYDVFGNDFFVDRMLSLASFVASIFLIHKICGATSITKTNSWFVILLFVTIPVVSWSFKNNMLENLMTVFCLVSVYLSILKFRNNTINSITYYSLNATVIFCAFISKGFTGLFPIATPLIISIIINKSKVAWVIQTSILLIYTFMFFAIVFIIFPPLKTFILEYLNQQIFASLNGKSDVDGRTFILTKMPQELMVLLIITMLLHISNGKKTFVILKQKITSNTDAQLFLCIALNASLPIIISVKQSGYYVLAAYPFFALFFAAINFNIFMEVIKKIKVKSKHLYVLTSMLVGSTVVLCAYNYKGFYRQRKNNACK